jgi:hypothetical protein
VSDLRIFYYNGGELMAFMQGAVEIMQAEGWRRDLSNNILSLQPNNTMGHLAVSLALQ